VDDSASQSVSESLQSLLHGAGLVDNDDRLRLRLQAHRTIY